jgi:hypothetical protein
MTNFQKAIITAVVVGSVGSAVYEACKASRLESGLRMLNEQHALLVAQIEQLESQRDETQRQRTAVPADKKGSDVAASELLRLRGEVNLLRRQIATADTKAQPATNQILFTQPVFPRAAWSDHGTDKPLNTILTMFWALRQGDESKLEQMVSRDRVSQTLDDLAYPKNDWERISAIQVVNVASTHGGGGVDTARAEVIVEEAPAPFEGAEKDVSIRRWILTKENDQWLIHNSF